MKSVKLNPELFDSEKYDENKIKESAEILLEAEEIKKDEVLMGKIKEFWKDQKKKIKSLDDLKDFANNFADRSEDSEEESEEEEDDEE